MGGNSAPVLNGMAGRYTEEWLRRWLRNPQAVTAEAFADAVGGTVSVDAKTGATIISVGASVPTVAELNEFNPKLTTCQALSEFVPNMGVHNGVPGAHVTVLTDRTDRVVGFELVSPAAAGWFPWFDQPKDTPMELPGLGEVYTQ